MSSAKQTLEELSTGYRFSWGG